MAAAPGCPRRGLPLLAGGGGEQPPARPPGLSGGLETADSAQPGAGRGRGWTKGTRGGEGAAGGKEGSPGREDWLETRGAALFPPWGTAEGPEGRRWGNRMRERGGGEGRAGDSLSTRALMHKG